MVEQSKEAYYLALWQTQGTIRTESLNWQLWLVFFLRSLAEQVAWAGEEGRAREDRAGSHAETAQLQIVGFTREHGRVTIGDGHQAGWGQPQHAEAAFTLTGRARHA